MNDWDNLYNTREIYIEEEDAGNGEINRLTWYLQNIQIYNH